MIAKPREDVTNLNTRARADLILDGTLKPGPEVELNDGTTTGVGDTIITRHNDRRLRNGADWVRNGERWIITRVRSDGSITIRKPGRKFGGFIVLPALYASNHVDLGYAITAHYAQGITTAHVLVEPTTIRENLYVALTHGRHYNHAYVVLNQPNDHTQPTTPTPQPALSSTGTLRRRTVRPPTAEHEHWGSIAQLAAEYETIAQAAQHDRWTTLIHASGLTPEQTQTVIDSDTFGALTAEMRRAEANHHNIDQLLPRLIPARSLDNTDDIAAVIHHRLARATTQPAHTGRTRQTPHLIAGLIPHANGPMTQEMRAALNGRRHLIETRANTVLDAALNTHQPWVTHLGPTPTQPDAKDRWRQQARTITAYRDRYAITYDTPNWSGPRRHIPENRPRPRHHSPTPPQLATGTQQRPGPPQPDQCQSVWPVGFSPRPLAVD